MRAVSILLFLCLLPFASVSAEQESLREALQEQLFAEANAALARANQVDAVLLTPETYRRAGETYKRAEEAFARGADVDRLRNILTTATKLFSDAAEMAPTVQEFVAAAFQARQDAIEADAQQRSPDLWQKAEEQLYEATSRAEKGREQRVPRYAEKAEALFRDAELDAIEKVLFTQIDEQIELARDLDADRWAPRSYQRAIQLLADARRVLAENRYDTDQPRNLARQAMHNVLHAQYVARLADDIDDRDTSLEAVLLEWENILRPIGEAVDVPLYFDQGPQEAVDAIMVAMVERSARMAQMQQDLATVRQRLSLVQEELLLAQSELENSEAAQARLDRRLAEQAAQEQSFSRVERLFNKEEAEVVRVENRLIIRLVGLAFASGSAELEQRHTALLLKLEDALGEFSGAPVTIEGHTDSYGADADNLTLSIRRAEAVAAYLQRNTSISATNLSAVGYGETRPIANNETAEGRAKNRRIDVVAYPAWWAR